MIRRLHRSRGGFTITELTIYVILGTLMTIAIGSITILFYGSIFRADVESRMTVESQLILRSIVDELRQSSGVASTNTLPDPYAPTGGWSTNSANAILIMRMPARDAAGELIMNTNTGEPYYNEFIYYAEGETMLRRVLADANAAGNTEVTTCPASAATSTCPADAVLSTNYQSMAFTFYDQDNAVTTDTLLARSVEMTITLSSVAMRQEIQIVNNIRITLRNLS